MLALRSNKSKELYDCLSFWFILCSNVIKVGFLEIVHHEASKAQLHVDKRDVFEDLRNDIIVILILLLFDKLQCFLEVLKCLFLSIGFQQEQRYVVIGCSSFVLS